MIDILTTFRGHERESWRARAACIGLDPLTFFPDSESNGDDDGLAAALEVCRACPVREECLEYAIETRQQDGVWGGTTADERRRIRRRRREAARRAS